MNLKSFVIVGAMALAMAGSAAGSSLNSYDPRNFSIDTYTPSSNEVQIAERRAQAFWAKNGARYGSDPVYLAVQTSKVFPSEVVQNLWPKIINSETTSSFFTQGRNHNPYGDLDLWGVMIYDTRTGHFVGTQGYVLVNTPPKGHSARFGPYIARYIGTGRW